MPMNGNRRPSRQAIMHSCLYGITLAAPYLERQKLAINYYDRPLEPVGRSQFTSKDHIVLHN